MPSVNEIRELLALLEGHGVRCVKLGDFEAEFLPRPVRVDGPKTPAGKSQLLDELKRPAMTVYEDVFLYTDKPGPHPDEIIPSFPTVDRSSTAPMSKHEEDSA